MKINIIYHDNGVGLSTEAKILKNEIRNHDVVLFNSIKLKPIEKADVNIFIQGFDFGVYRYFDMAKKNILVPNQEWLNYYEGQIAKNCDQIWCKTKYAYNKMLFLNKNCILTGFTSIDSYDPNIKKERKFLHFKGLSEQKNTELVIKTFKNSIYPLTICDPNKKVLSFNGNIKLHRRYISNKEKDYEMNSSAIHLCPSIMEGWGHYAFEGLSCGANLILPDAPIFNEITNKDIAYFIPAEKRYDESIKFSQKKEIGLYPLRESYFVKEETFKFMCDFLYQQPPKFNSLARQYFLENQFWFRKRLEEVLSNI